MFVSNKQLDGLARPLVLVFFIKNIVGGNTAIVNDGRFNTAFYYI